jgi:hypothetical protein
MAMHVETSWTALDVRGFVVVKGFLSTDDVVALEAAYRRARRVEVAEYVAMEPDRECLLPLLHKVRGLLGQIQRATRSAADTVVDQGVFFATELTRLGWHSDYKSHYVFQGHRDHLSF